MAPHSRWRRGVSGVEPSTNFKICLGFDLSINCAVGADSENWNARPRIGEVVAMFTSPVVCCCAAERLRLLDTFSLRCKEVNFSVESAEAVSDTFKVSFRMLGDDHRILPPFGLSRC